MCYMRTLTNEIVPASQFPLHNFRVCVFIFYIIKKTYMWKGTAADLCTGDTRKIIKSTFVKKYSIS